MLVTCIRRMLALDVHPLQLGSESDSQTTALPRRAQASKMNTPFISRLVVVDVAY